MPGKAATNQLARGTRPSQESDPEMHALFDFHDAEARDLLTYPYDDHGPRRLPFYEARNAPGA